MKTDHKFIRFLAWLGVVILQLVMTQVVTFLISMLIPSLEGIQQAKPWLFALVLGISFSIGVFLTGWAALKWHWLKTRPILSIRLVGTILGACLPLFLALFLYPWLEPGNPFFFISGLMSVIGFHVPGWTMKKCMVIEYKEGG